MQITLMWLACLMKTTYHFHIFNRHSLLLSLIHLHNLPTQLLSKKAKSKVKLNICKLNLIFGCKIRSTRVSYKDLKKGSVILIGRYISRTYIWNRRTGFNKFRYSPDLIKHLSFGYRLHGKLCSYIFHLEHSHKSCSGFKYLNVDERILFQLESDYLQCLTLRFVNGSDEA